MAPRHCDGRSCRARLDVLGDHWAACPRSGRLRRRARPLERTWARVLREGGARVAENVLLRDSNLEGIAPTDGRQLEIVATGLPLEQGVPLGCDVTMVSPLHADGSAWAGADSEAGVALARAEAAKAATYPELVGSARLRLVTLACEVGGRWSSGCVHLVRALARHRAESAPEALRGAIAGALAARWWAMLSVAAQSTLAATLVDDAVGGLDGVPGDLPPWAEVALEEKLEPRVSRLPLRAAL